MDNPAQWNELQGEISGDGLQSRQDARRRAYAKGRRYRANRRDKLLLSDSALYYRAVLRQWQEQWKRLFKTEESLKAGNPFLYRLFKQRLISRREMPRRKWKFSDE